MDETILIVDDEPSVRKVLRRALVGAGYPDVLEAETAEEARRRLEQDGPVALVLLDIGLPGENGLQFLNELALSAPKTVAVMVTAAQDVPTAVQAVQMGAYDYVCKPAVTDELALRVASVLERRRLEIRMRQAERRIQDEIEERLARGTRVRRALLSAVCRMGEFRDAAPNAHPERVARYSRLIAEQLPGNQDRSRPVNQQFIQNIFECAHLHDIGKVGVPESILLKPGELAPSDMLIMQTHTTIGRDICRAVRTEIGPGDFGFIDMAAEITGSHHEHWDGKGYPDGLQGADIPLSARIVGLADFYDSCRNSTVYRPRALDRHSVLNMISQEAGRKFDPAVVAAFLDCESEIPKIERFEGPPPPTGSRPPYGQPASAAYGG